MRQEDFSELLSENIDEVIKYGLEARILALSGTLSGEEDAYLRGLGDLPLDRSLDECFELPNEDFDDDDSGDTTDALAEIDGVKIQDILDRLSELDPFKESLESRVYRLERRAVRRWRLAAAEERKGATEVDGPDCSS